MKPKRGAPRKQPRTITALQKIGMRQGYNVQPRKKDPKHKVGEKKFLPDLIAEPLWGTKWRAFEVEATATNNTIYKSLVSLLHFLAKHPNAEAYLVVPQKHFDFATECLDHMKYIIRSFNKNVQGANPKIRLSVLTFEDVATSEVAFESWVENSKVGRPPKCVFFPRPR
jgi:hypothetical protein